MSRPFSGWDGAPNFRWVKMFQGVRYYQTCAELGLPKDQWTKEDSMAAAEAWWTATLATLAPDNETRLDAIEALLAKRTAGKTAAEITAEIEKLIRQNSSWACPECGFPTEKEALGCEYCGANYVDELCPICKNEVSYLADSCPHCHHDLSGLGGRLQTPYPFFGIKRKVAEDIWKLFRHPKRYIEPFLGSGSIVINRPQDGTRIHCVVNDQSRYISNFWRAVRFQPEELVKWADWPVNDADLMARSAWLKGQDFEGMLELSKPDLFRLLKAMPGELKSDPMWCDPKIAGWWAWGQCSAILGGWLDDKTPSPERINVKGINAIGRSNTGRPVGVNRPAQNLLEYFHRLQGLLHDVIVICGDWRRVVSPAVLGDRYPCAVFLDPPYKEFGDKSYRIKNSDQIARDAWMWCNQNGANPNLHIMLCGYDTDYAPLQGWSQYQWFHNKGMNKDHKNAGRERIWCSPAIKPVHGLKEMKRIG